MLDPELKPRFLRLLFTLTFVGGIAFYFAWGFAFDAFFDLANYTMSVILIFSGLFGSFLYRELEKEKATSAKPQ